MQFCYTTMACAIHEAIENESRIHIVDFALWAGQWPLVIRQLASSRPPTQRIRLKFTAIVAPPGHASGAGPVLSAPALCAELTAACAASNVELIFQVTTPALLASWFWLQRCVCWYGLQCCVPPLFLGFMGVLLGCMTHDLGGGTHRQGAGNHMCDM